MEAAKHAHNSEERAGLEECFIITGLGVDDDSIHGHVSSRFWPAGRCCSREWCECALACRPLAFESESRGGEGRGGRRSRWPQKCSVEMVVSFKTF